MPKRIKIDATLLNRRYTVVRGTDERWPYQNTRGPRDPRGFHAKFNAAGQLIYYGYFRKRRPRMDLCLRPAERFGTFRQPGSVTTFKRGYIWQQIESGWFDDWNPEKVKSTRTYGEWVESIIEFMEKRR